MTDITRIVNEEPEITQKKVAIENYLISIPEINYDTYSDDFKTDMCSFRFYPYHRSRNLCLISVSDTVLDDFEADEIIKRINYFIEDGYFDKNKKLKILSYLFYKE
jgi:hypothetical protein